MAEPVMDVRRRAAQRAQEVMSGALSADAFREEFADVDDRAVAELLDLMEHEPARRGLLGGGESAWENYRESMREIIDSLAE
ncbi:MAG TPA: hypothetical protein VFW66_04265 [Gemmatimonadales bacterium]|nr:hypothetical protein [Gemmatimonadales bacterium]